ncbi:peptidoglycan-binding protein [Streptomyces sp. NBC_01356]|uniref:peptidoglycan-binding protein n=1 Tax=Streptomyces sp. NBC_01356 TaxID=2903836 RepID=UPI002E35A622|nr:peptidoglycan-binding protein [Streptomyces sp. NBC_01356]
MASTAAAMVKSASADVGYKEGANNDTKHGVWYGLNHNPWCDMAVSYWADKSGNADVVGKFAYCPSHVNFFKGKSRWHGKSEATKVGDIVFYDWDGDGVADHVGIVEKASAAGASIYTIEGNTSSGAAGSQSNGDGCYRRTRSRSGVMGFGRPAYKTETVAAKPAVAYEPFPGAAFFKAKPKSAIVTAMGKRLEALGYKGYKSGPGAQWTDADKAAYAWFQRKLGYSGAAADGWPGAKSWAALKVPKV